MDPRAPPDLYTVLSCAAPGHKQHRGLAQDFRSGLDASLVTGLLRQLVTSRRPHEDGWPAPAGRLPQLGKRRPPGVVPEALLVCYKWQLREWRLLRVLPPRASEAPPTHGQAPAPHPAGHGSRRSWRPPSAASAPEGPVCRELPAGRGSHRRPRKALRSGPRGLRGGRERQGVHAPSADAADDPQRHELALVGGDDLALRGRAPPGDHRRHRGIDGALAALHMILHLRPLSKLAWACDPCPHA
mmetsp:Transcript_58449/g.150997  ORF Transcript_58449/g.150997 Transcript_58449/m.150997 type:complete len:243 (+) Transcript_58449:253-981(+)